MTALIKKIHMYIGLLNFVTLTVFGIAGLTATFDSGPGRRNEPQPARFQEFTAAPGASDKDVADQVFRTLNIPLSNPIPKQALRRNSENQLAFDFYTMNGIHRVTVLEKESRLRVEPAPNRLGALLALTGRRATRRPAEVTTDFRRVKLWRLGFRASL